jgi:small subunit ribosomal protein S3
LGQKTHPVGFRLGVIKTWSSRWYASDDKFADFVYEDIMVRRYISRRLPNAGISNVVISRASKKVTVDIMTARPGIVIGRRGAEVDKLREELQLLTSKEVLLNIVEVRRPELDAQLVADSVARQLEGRVSFRRAMKKSLGATMKMGADGIRIQCSGRLGGAEIARTEKYMDGRVPLHTLRADIDYATSTANTTYGTIGVKVWICRGEVLGSQPPGTEKEEAGAPGVSEPPVTPRSRRGGRPGDRSRKRPRARVRRQARPGEGEAPRGRRPEAPRPERDKPSGSADESKSPKPGDKPSGSDSKPDSSE